MVAPVTLEDGLVQIWLCEYEYVHELDREMLYNTKLGRSATGANRDNLHIGSSTESSQNHRSRNPSSW